MTFLRKATAALLLGVVAASGGCSSDDDVAKASGPTPTPTPPDQGEIRYEAFDWTRELNADSLAAITNVSDEDGSIRFRGAPVQLAGTKPGDVLVTAAHPTTPKGLLRQVLAVRTEGGDTVIDTQPVAMQLAFKTLHAKITATPHALDGVPAPGAVAPQGRYSAGKKIGGGQKIDWQVFDADGKRDTKDDQLYVTGEVTGAVGFSVYIDLDWVDDPKRAAEELACALSGALVCTPSLPDVTVGAKAFAIAKAQIDVEGAAATSFDHDEFPIDGASFDLPPLSIGPVLIYPSIDFVALVTGSSTSRVHATAGFEYSVSTEVSVGLKSGPRFQPPTFTKSISPPTVDVSLTSELKVSVGPRIKLLLWDMFGPHFTVAGYGNLRANSEKTPCWAVDVGVDLIAGVNLQIPWKLFGLRKLGRLLGLDGNIASTSFPPTNLFNVPNVLTGACGKIPDDIYPPGDGPTADVYKAPTFKPWSQRYQSDKFTFPVSGESSPNELHVTKSVDGSWLAAGLGVPGVIKLGEDGRVIWSKALKLPRVLPGEVDDQDDENRSALVAQAKNTNLWVAASRFTVMQLDQSGDLVWARRYVPADPQIATAVEATGLVSTDDGGALLVYSLKRTPAEGPAVVLRLDRNGKLLFAKSFSFETSRTFVPGFVAAGDGDVFMTGYSWESGSNIGHVARLRPDGSTVFAKKLGLCGSDRVRPARAIRLASGAFAFASTYSLAPERSAIVQMSPEGTTVTASAWWTGSSTKDSVSNAIAQLPISGFLTMSAGFPVGQSSIQLASHDAQGAITLQRELLLQDATAKFEVRPGAVRMTNDGGVLVFAHTQDQDTFRPGLWISKLPARTLDAAFDPAQVTRKDGSLVADTCAATLSPDTLTLTDLKMDVLDPANIGVTDDPLTVVKLIP